MLELGLLIYFDRNFRNFFFKFNIEIYNTAEDIAFYS